MRKKGKKKVKEIYKIILKIPTYVAAGLQLNQTFKNRPTDSETVTCSSRWWIRVGHVASSRGRPLVEAILLGRWWVGIALRSRWRWAIAIHHTR